MKREICSRVDDRYLITRKDRMFTLHEIKHGVKESTAVIALYADPLELVNDLVNHSLRRNKAKNIAGLIEETKRLAMQCAPFVDGEKSAF
ncbi:DUF5405 family protein [Serratia fonticola]